MRSNRAAVGGFALALFFIWFSALSSYGADHLKLKPSWQSSGAKGKDQDQASPAAPREFRLKENWHGHGGARESNTTKLKLKSNWQQ